MKLSLVFMSLCMLATAGAATVYATETATPKSIQGQINANLETVRSTAKYKQEPTLAGVIGSIIQFILGIVGLIFLIMMSVAGFKWLTSQGEEKKVGEALNLLNHSIYGLVFTMSVYALTVYITNELQKIVLLPK